MILTIKDYHTLLYRYKEKWKFILMMMDLDENDIIIILRKDMREGNKKQVKKNGESMCLPIEYNLNL